MLLQHKSRRNVKKKLITNRQPWRSFPCGGDVLFLRRAVYPICNRTWVVIPVVAASDAPELLCGRQAIGERFDKSL